MIKLIVIPCVSHPNFTIQIEKKTLKKRNKTFSNNLFSSEKNYVVIKIYEFDFFFTLEML